MKSTLLIASVLLTACAAAPPVVKTAASPAAPSAADTRMHEVWSSALQADGRAALRQLESIDATQLSEKNRIVYICMRDRLGKATVDANTLQDRFLSQVLASYQAYWLRALHGTSAAADNEARLLADLNRSAVADGAAAADNLGDLETTLSARVVAHGLHSLHGVTAPLREFMLWKTETEAHYDVALPQGHQAVTVVFMDDFSSLGWAAYATCDRVHAGGWTKPDRLYAVRSGYDLGSENFRVSYLAHEARHFADNAAFPDLEQPELEYRAKLTELALAETTQSDLLHSFAGNTSDDRAIPHSYANGRAIADLRKALGLDSDAALYTTPPQRIRAAAGGLLRDDTARRAAPVSTPKQ